MSDHLERTQIGQYTPYYNQETKDKLELLWLENKLSTAKIGEALGWGTKGKNRVIGLARRMGLPKKPSPIGVVSNKPRKPRAAYRPKKTLPSMTPAASADDKAAKPATPAKLAI